MNPRIKSIARDLRHQAGFLTPQRWNSQPAARIAEAAVAVRETALEMGWTEAAGRATELAARCHVATEATPAAGEIAHLASLAEGLAECLDQLLTATMDGVFLPGDPGKWTFLLLGEDLSHSEVSFNQLRLAGFEVAAVASRGELRGRLKALGQQAIVVCEAGWLGANPMPPHDEDPAAAPIVVALGGESSFNVRLAALRAGAGLLLPRAASAETLLTALCGLAWQPAQAYRVMVVDHDPLTLEFGTMVLRSVDFEVAAEQDPLAVLNLIEDFDPEVLLLDIDMPVCQGTELLHMLRQRQSLRLLPVICFSAHGDIDYILAARRAGCDEYLVKPVPVEVLRLAVTNSAGKYRRIRQITDQLQQTCKQLDHGRAALDAHAIVSVAAPDGTIRMVNDKFCEVSGYSREELLGRNHRLLKSGIHPPEFYRELWQTIGSGRAWRGEICNRRKDGNLYWVDASIVPSLDEHGKPYQFVSIRTEITRLKATEEELRRSGELSHAILDSLSPNIAVLDRNGVILAVNQSWRRFALENSAEPGAMPRSTQVGSNYLEVCQQGSGEEAEAARQASEGIRLVSTGGLPSFSLEYPCHSPDQPRWFSMLVTPLDAEERGVVVVHSDITWRKQTELVLAESERRLSKAQHIARLGYWSLDAASGRLDWSDPVYAIHGVEPADYAPDIRTYYAEFVHPEDLAGLRAEEQAAYQSGRTHSMDYRILCPDGSRKWLHIEGILVTDELGRPGLNGIIQDITDRKEIEVALTAARDAAVEASRAKSEFLASMSHELRTPLNAVLGHAQLLTLDPRQPAGVKDQAGEIERAGKYLLSLVNDLIDLARIEAGKLEVSMETLQLGAVVRSSLALVAPIAAKHGIELRDELGAGGAALLCADFSRLRQVIINLLSNAIKYNRPRGSVRVLCGLRDGRVRLTVVDTGPGIALEKQARIFTAFDRLGAECGPLEGSGIGLNISRRIVEAMGGTIGFESSQGMGSSFWVEFAGVAPAADRRAPEPTAPAMLVAAGGGAPRQLVLHIEDNPMNQRLMRQILAFRADLELREAHTAEIGIDLARAEPPALILMDINLPGMDGYAALQVLKADPSTARIPVIAVSANVMKGDIARGLAAGFAAYVGKPLDVSQFLEQLDRLLESGAADAGVRQVNRSA